MIANSHKTKRQPDQKIMQFHEDSKKPKKHYNTTISVVVSWDGVSKKNMKKIAEFILYAIMKSKNNKPPTKQEEN